MNKLATQYATLALKNPLIASSSPLTGTLECAQELEQAGVAAIILPSLFEEEILQEEEEFYAYLLEQDIGSAEHSSFLPDSLGYKNATERYLEKIQQYKQQLSIPVIASLNGIDEEILSERAQEIEQAGADALEINLYQVICAADCSAADVEQRYLKLLKRVRAMIRIPLIVKLSSQFTALPHFCRQLESVGVNAVALFNRFYQPDIHLDSLQIKHEIKLSTPYEAMKRIRWTAILRDHLAISIGVTGGMHQGEQIIKAILAGADATYLCSHLLEKGSGAIKPLLDTMRQWLDEKECLSLEQIKGSISYSKAVDSSAYERAAYVDLMSRNNWRLQNQQE